MTQTHNEAADTPTHAGCDAGDTSASAGGFALDSYLAEQRGRLDLALREMLAPRDGHEDPLQLRAAMVHSVLAGGKRLRPCLTVAAAEAVGGSIDEALPAACAIELVHSYSLVHDDLPAMDDDDMRRGAPTCHKKYGEATAILVGDALLTLAFETLAADADAAREDATRQRALVRATLELGRAAGRDGMVGGQALDMSLKDGEPTFDVLERCHLGKTAALFSASTAIGALVGGGDDAQVELLRGYGRDLGLAFQHADDLRDAEFVSHRERALSRATDLSRQAAEAARSLGAPAAALVALADLVEQRAKEVIR